MFVSLNTPRRSLRLLLGAVVALALLGAAAPAQAQFDLQWQQSGFLGQTVRQVLVDPTTPGKVYAALPFGDLFRSTNGGQGWSLLYDLLYADPPVLAIDPNDPDTLYASSVGFAFKSIDGGATWVELTIHDITAWAIDPADSRRVYAGSGQLDRFYRSTNGGSSWTESFLFSGARELAVDAAGGVIYGAFTNPTTSNPNPDDGVYRSNDQGLTWTRVYSSHIATALAVDPAQAGVIYLGTDGDGILRSADYGATWQPINVGLDALTVRDLLLDPREPPTLYAGTWGGGVFRSRDQGASWTPMNSGLSKPFVFSLALDPSGNGTLYAGTNSGGIYRIALLPDVPKPTDTYAHVLDSSGQPLAGALIYHNGVPASGEAGTPPTSDLRGNLILAGARPGDRLVALQLIHEQPTARAAHAGWAYRVYRTSLEVTNDGALRGGTILETPGPQDLIVRPTNTLILFNMVISVEWDADTAYLEQIARAARAASDFLYDASDGQMAFGQVQIFRSGQHWAAADIQISTNNVVRPHAFIGGITSGDPAHVIRVGRAWDGGSGSAGPWDQPDGFRTLTHEFGHYGLYLYDEYFGYRFDASGRLIETRNTTCSGMTNRNAATQAINASVMDYHYTSSEFSMRGVGGLWGEPCTITAQFQLNGDSAWETLARRYADPTAASRWVIRTPASHGGVVAGPADLPDTLLNLPQVTIATGGGAAASYGLTALGPDGAPYPGVIIALYKQDGRVIGQGFTDLAGQITIFGAEVGDLVRGATFDGAMACQVTIRDAGELICRLQPVQLGAGLSGAEGIPHLRLIPAPSAAAGRVDLLIGLQNFPPDSGPFAYITEPGSDISRSPLLAYSPERSAFEARISFSANQTGNGQLWADRRAGGDRPVLQTSYRLQRIDNRLTSEVFSNDGNLRLFLEAGSLPGAASDLVVMAPGAVPGPLPAGLALLGSPYDITASGAVVALERPGALSLHYDSAVAQGRPPESIGLYRWDPAERQWRALPSVADPESGRRTASITALGTYALLAAGEPIQAPLKVHLPLLRS